MQVKKLGWQDNCNHEGLWLNSFNTDSIPQILYRIRPYWDDVLQVSTYRIEFSHGWVSDNEKKNCHEQVGPFYTLEEAKMQAQRHFNRYVIETFLVT